MSATDPNQNQNPSEVKDNPYQQQAPGQQPAYPPPGGYAAPPPGGYAAPPPGGYAAPPPGGYAAPPPGGYAQPPGGYAAPPQGGYPPPGYAPAGAPGYPPPPPMQQQQQQQQWMVRPSQIPGCPPGLEYLTQIDQVLVHQQVELLEAFTGFETCNRYVLKNSVGQQVYFAGEESDMCARQMCQARRGFTMHISDNAGQEVFRAVRDFKYCGGGNCCASCDACQMTLSVEAPPGNVIGHIRQDCSFLAPLFNVCDANENPVLKIEGPACMLCPQFCEQKFEVQTMDGSAVGAVTKQFGGLVRELYTNADNFGVTFPMDLSVNVKATLIGAVFLIDFMYFENRQNNN